MKKLISVLFVLLCLSGLLVSLASCDLHIHTYDEAVWEYNESNHWHVCQYDGCGADVLKANHTFTEKIRIDATCVTGGKVVEACACGYEKTTELPIVAHDFGEATCEKPRSCKYCPATEGTANPHIWAAASCTAPKTCTLCQRTEGDVLGHDIIEELIEPTCLDEGLLSRLCSRCEYKESDEVLPQLGHILEQIDEPAQDGNNNIITIKCKRCDYTTTRTKIFAAVMVVDMSSSMRDSMGGGRSRFDVVLEGVKNVITNDTFMDTDFVGVILFDHNYHVALELQELGDSENRENISNAIEYEMKHYFYSYYLDPDGNETDIPIHPADGQKYTSQGYTRPEGYDRGATDKITGQFIKSYGTTYKGGIEAADKMLTEKSEKVKLDSKQMLFISDGAPNDAGSGYIEIVEQMLANGTYTSVLEIGDDGGERELSKITEAARGRMKRVTDAESLAEAMIGLINFNKAQ